MSDKESFTIEYFNHCYSYLEILAFLLLHFSIVIGYQILKRCLQKVGLKRRILPNSRVCENVLQNEILAQLF